MLQVIQGSELLELIQNRIAPLGVEAVILPLTEANGRILASDITCPEEVPCFNRSTVDGYAVHAADTYGCSETVPTRLSLLGAIEMGETSDFIINAGQAVYVPTGGFIPEGADAMVMIENAEVIGDGYVYIQKSSAPGNNIIYKGDDIKAGLRLLSADTRLKPHHMGMLAAAGVTEVPVKPRVRVAVISTGDELVEPDKPQLPGMIRDVNSYFLSAAIKEAGADPILCGIIRDDYDVLYKTAEIALETADMLLISGGSSVGLKDNTECIISSLPETELLVHGLAIKPGKPTLLGVSTANKVIFGLPGHPLSAYFIFRIFVTAAIARLEGAKRLEQIVRQAVLSVNYPSNGGREEYVPVTLISKDGVTAARPVFSKSGLISLLGSADGYIRISRDKEGINRGETVEVTLF